MFFIFINQKRDDMSPQNLYRIDIYQVKKIIFRNIIIYYIILLLDCVIFVNKTFKLFLYVLSLRFQLKNKNL